MPTIIHDYFSVILEFWDAFELLFKEDEEIKGHGDQNNVVNVISFVLDEYLAIRPSYLGVYFPQFNFFFF